MYTANRTYRFIAISLAFLIFTSSAGFSVDMHFCQDRLKSISLFGKAKNCHEMAQRASCPHHAVQAGPETTCGLEKKGCCQNRTLHFQTSQDQVAQSYDQLSPDQPTYQYAAMLPAAGRMTIGDKSILFFHYLYKPPPLIRDLQVQYQSFRC